MAIKKSELYSSLWASCDALRGGMDASQYKDYVLVLLFIKYVSDKYADTPNAMIRIPKNGGFKSISELKGQKDIGEKIDTIIGALAKENDLKGVIDVVSFNDDDKLGKGKEMIDRLSELVGIFENPSLDFSKNRAEGDDILGDAYEYLMRHFATESGKSKGQFYTPSEVSRVMAKVLGIKNATAKTSFYDPTCGSGSLLLKALDEADGKGTLYGQEKDVATAGLAKMNMILHGSDYAEIKKGQSTLSHPLFLDGNGYIQTFDYVVANPPFSLKNWTSGFNPYEDEHNRFDGFAVPPEKNGDFAFLLHILKSLRSRGKGAIILPHGVLFRGGSEAEIRKNLIQKGYIKSIIGLPPNLFYGTGIPACIIVLDKEDAANRTGIFMIDASKNFMKDGNKNRLRDQDIHKIVDVFTKQSEVLKYSRFVPNEEIANEKNDYNLNIPRYIDSQEPEDIQDIEAHLLGGIPNADIDALDEYWQVYPSLKKVLFEKSDRKGYSDPKVEKELVKQTIFNHAEFKAFSSQMQDVFVAWMEGTSNYLRKQDKGLKPKKIIHQISESLLEAYTDKKLIDKYDVYQHLLDYWNEVMQDDCYIISSGGWKAEPYRILIENKKKEKVDKGWACDLVPKELIVNRYFEKEKEELLQLESEKEAIGAKIQEMEEEHGGEEGAFAELDKVNKANAQKRLKEIKGDKNLKEEIKLLEEYLKLIEEQTELNSKIRDLEIELDEKVLGTYPKLSKDEIKRLVIDDKWSASIGKRIQSELDKISQRLTQRIRELEERYEVPLPLQNKEADSIEKKVKAHLKKMGFTWE
ncbi:MAG: Type I restriction-modification system, DNA-methyltransferase subunit M [Cytophagales bacterium]|jgi:type I restriction enzyme M protein|nr:type I restriction-modification system subunit M [Bacteroidota bacterium]WHZ06828.1 MAG: Type I restriction-modification system, DNA-methyltransferase subunit M [Cytophagales bacterium]